MNGKIYCVQCSKYTQSTPVKGYTVYPRSPKLRDNNFWACPECANFVGCHPGTAQPLGVIANKELKQARMKIHALLDPIWKNGKMPRRDIYTHITGELGYTYHTAWIRSMEEARVVWNIVAKLHNGLL